VKPLPLAHYAVSISAVAALLAGCGGSQPPISAIPQTAAVVAPTIPSSLQHGMASHKYQVLFSFGSNVQGGLPRLIGETIFQHSLKVGITRADVIQLERRLGGEDGIPDSSLSETGGAPGTIDVRFADYAALYGTSGKWFQLDFGPDWRLSSWKVESWGSFL
jgi:hypothetical protein